MLIVDEELRRDEIALNLVHALHQALHLSGQVGVRLLVSLQLSLQVVVDLVVVLDLAERVLQIRRHFAQLKLVLLDLGVRFLVLLGLVEDQRRVLLRLGDHLLDLGAQSVVLGDQLLAFRLHLFVLAVDGRQWHVLLEDLRERARGRVELLHGAFDLLLAHRDHL